MNYNLNTGYGQLLSHRLFHGHPGKVLIVAPTSAAGYDILRQLYIPDPDGTVRFFTTISSAYSAAVASRGDVILIHPSYTETVTASKTLSKEGVTLKGLGWGTFRPTITGNGTIDVFNVTGANTVIDNIYFAAPGTDDQTADINVAAAGVQILNTYHVGSTTAKNKTDIITVAAGSHNLLVDGVRATNNVVDCVSFLSLEGISHMVEIRNLFVAGQFSTAALMDEATSTFAYIHHNVLKNTKAATAVVSFANNSTGVMSFNHISGRHTTIASNVAAGTGMDFFENRVVEEAALNGMIMPAADAD